jgi:uncharacterized protein (TIGR00369 family)
VTSAIWEEEAHGGNFPRELFGLAGIEQVRMLTSGKVQLPPIHYLTGMRPTEVGVGSSTFVMPITGWLLTPQGLMTAGEIAILADGPLGCAIQTVLPPATGYTTTELSINMVRPVPRQGQLLARGRLVHGGRQLGLSEVFVTDDVGRLIAHGTSRCVIFPPDPSVPTGAPPPSAPAPDPDHWVPPYRRPVAGEALDQEVFDKRSGLEVMAGLVSGELPLPPITHLMGIRPTAAEDGSATFTIPATRWLTSPLGFVEGGVTACVADFALCSAIQTTVPVGTAYAPTELRVQFIRPVPADGRLVTARATVVHRGRGLAVARSDVTNEDGKLVAIANASALILPGRRADLADAALGP